MPSKRFHRKKRASARGGYRRSRAPSAFRKSGKQSRSLFDSTPPALKMVRLGNGFPESVRTVLRYRDYYSVATSSGTNFAEAIMSGNSMYDPDFSGWTRNQQPRYHDQFSLIYKNYRVNAARLKVYFTPNAATVAAGAYIYVIHASTKATADTTDYADNIDGLLECTDTVSTLANYPASTNTLVLTMEKNLKDMFPSFYKSSDVCAAVDANPIQQWYFHVTVWDQARNVSTGTITCYINAEVELDVTYNELQNTASS